MMYETFDDWLNEIEVMGTRYERFLEEWDHGMDPARMKEWLRAAWECSREVPLEEIAMLKWRLREQD